MPAEELTDLAMRRLLRRLEQGDREAFWPIWRAQEEHLRRICLRRMEGEPEEARDALSAVMLKAYEQMPQHASAIRQVRPWLTRMAVNLCADIHRARLRMPTDSLDLDTIPEKAVAAPPTHAVEEEADDAADLSPSPRRLEMALETLSPRLREVVVLRFVEKKDYARIASETGVSSATVRKRIERARHILRGKLQRPGGDNADRPAVDVPAKTFFPAAEEAPASVLESDPAKPAPRGSLQPEHTDRRAAVRLVTVSFSGELVLDLNVPVTQSLGREQTRIETLRRYVEQHPTGWKKRYELAYLLYARGEWALAAEEYRRILASNERGLGIWIEYALLLRRMRRRDEARTALERALALADREEVRGFLQGHLECVQGRPARARAAWERTAPAHASSRHALAEMHWEAGRAGDCLNVCEAAVACDPDDLVALAAGRECLADMGRTSAARAWAERIIAIDPDCIPALAACVESRCAAGDARGDGGKTVRECIRRIAQAGPDCVALQRAKTRYYFARGEWRKGVEELNGYVLCHPKNPGAWRALAEFLALAGSGESAAKAALQASALDPEDPGAAVLACRAVSASILAEGAPAASPLRPDLRVLLHAMLLRFPEHGGVWAAAARAVVEVFHETERAAALSCHALTLRAGDAAPWLEHAVTLRLAGDTPDAARALEEMRRRLPEDDAPALWVQMTAGAAECRGAMGDVDGARAGWDECAARAAALAPDDPADAAYYLGLAHERMGDRGRAESHYTLALSHHLAYPRRRGAKTALRRLRAHP